LDLRVVMTAALAISVNRYPCLVDSSSFTGRSSGSRRGTTSAAAGGRLVKVGLGWSWTGFSVGELSIAGHSSGDVAGEGMCVRARDSVGRHRGHERVEGPP
jgi:hypothetical protein